MAEWENNENEEQVLEGVAIVGLAGRFPKAQDVETFWQNLCAGVEGITFLNEDEDVNYKLAPELKQNPDYVSASSYLENIDLFDATFFGYNAREAQMIDPQQRLFLEASWEALERAGYDSKQYDGRIGVFAGAGANMYFRHHLYPRRGIREQIGAFSLKVANDNDFAATRVSYKLDLKGPSFTVQTACSTSLTAVGLACQSLLTYQSDMALAGGVSIESLEKSGYLYEQGSILSPDGHNRTFDAAGAGTVPGNGLGVVVLKRLEDAVADGDQIYAVIKSVAINNDGEAKMGFTAPSIEGQTDVILEALGLAGVEADTISYVEAHGTATNIGDPIEVTALTQAYRASTDQTGYCAIGSVKSNLGHLDVAAGVAGLIKTTLSLHHKTLVPSLHYTQPNPQIDFESSPFYVNTELKAWPAGKTPRRAGVSSFGLGGTNVHAILEEAPELAPSGPARAAQVVMLSAKTRTALDQMTDNLADYLEAHPEVDLADAAYTLHIGRRAFNNRRVLVASTREEVIAELRARTPQRVFTISQEPSERPLAFLFSGQGGQYVQMARGLYESEAVFRDVVDECAELLTAHIGSDIREVLFPEPHQVEQAEARLQQTGYMLPALFVVQYATTQLLSAWGLQPEAMIGHSFGEFAAACYAGVMSLSDALYVVAKRGQFMQETEAGAMLSINLSEQAVRPYLGERLSMAAINGPELCVVSGTPADIEALATRLAADEIECRKLHVTCANHSWMMEEASKRFRTVMAEIELHAPQVPIVSCATGAWLTEEQATSPDYWAQHLLLTVRYAEAVHELLTSEEYATVEIGPGRAMTTMMRQQQALAQTPSITTIRHPHDTQSDVSFLLENVGRLWLTGVTLDAKAFYSEQSRRRVLLPTYPFERRRYWIEPANSFLSGNGAEDAEGALAEEEEIGSVEVERSALMTDYVAPRNETEQKVAQLWGEFLGVDQIGVYDNFFELGGHSLLGIKLMKKTRDTFAVELSERTLYESPTIAHLADAIDAGMNTEISKIMPVPRDQDILASWVQEKVWQREQQYPGDSYDFSIGFTLRGPLKYDIFMRALHEVVKRHEVLRTTFTERESDGQLLQVIHEPYEVECPLVDLTHLPMEERFAEMERLAYIEECKPFDMTKLPLFRMELYRLEEDKFGWNLSGHASVWDGISQDIFVNDLHDIYVALEKGEAWQLPELTIQYADYAQWERQYFSGERYETVMNFWRSKYETRVEQLSLPTNRPRSEKWHGFGKEEYHETSNHLAEPMRALATQHGATLYMTMLSAFNMLFSRLSGQNDIMLETSFSTRTSTELEGMVAPLTNFIGIRTDLADDPTYLEVLERTRENVLGAFDYTKFPFDKVMKEFQPHLYSKKSPRLNVMVTYHTVRDFKGLPGMEIEERIWARRAMFDFYIGINDMGENGLVFSSEFNSDIFDKATMDNMFLQLENVIAAIAENPNVRLSELPVGSLIPETV